MIYLYNIWGVLHINTFQKGANGRMERNSFHTKHQLYYMCARGSVLRKVKSILDRINIRNWIGKEAVINVQYITSCRNWKKWLLGCTLPPKYPIGGLEVCYYLVCFMPW